MAKPARMELLRKAVEKSPQADFPRYALAMELVSDQQFEAAEGQFLKLLEHHPEHVPGHFMLGKLYSQLGRIGDAKNTLQEGMECARKKGDFKTVNEMQDALDQLES